MKSRTLFAATAAWLLVASVIAGCESGRERPPAVTVRVLHAAPQRATVNFLREQRNEAQLEYRQASAPLFFDADEYDFNVWALDATGDSSSLIGSFSRELVPDNRYFIALTEAAGEMTPIVVEVEPFSGSSAEVIAIHAAPSLGPMSVYIEADGIVPSSVAAAGSIGFGESIQSVEREEGTYRLSLTEADNPANVLLTSGIFTLEDGQSYIFAILDPTEDSTTSMSVAFIGPEPTLLFDESVQSSLTVVNAAADGLPRDVYIDDDFSAPLLAAVPPFDRSADTPVAFGDRTISVTPAGDTGVVEDDITASLTRSRHHVAMIGGDPGELTVTFAVDERRRITGHSRIAFMNGATQLGDLEFFLVPPGTDLSQLVSTIVLDAPAMTARVTFPPGEYELIAREEDGPVVGGPVPVTLSGGGIYAVLATNGATPGTVDFVYFDDFVD